jgi:hypothetical protein
LCKRTVESDNFLIKFEFKIMGSDGQEKMKRAFEKMSSEFEVGTGWGFSEAFLLTDVFDVQKKYLSENNTLTINVTVSFPSFLLGTHFIMSSFIKARTAAREGGNQNS